MLAAIQTVPALPEQITGEASLKRMLAARGASTHCDGVDLSVGSTDAVQGSMAP